MDDTYEEGVADAGKPRRPWLLIGACLLLVTLSVVLWAKWSESRTEVQRLRQELKEVYTEAEGLRTQATRAQERVTVLEQQLQGQPRSAEPAQDKAPARVPKQPAPKRR
jgi:sensor c-di-GMP phosphodiesterase-like protein